MPASSARSMSCSTSRRPMPLPRCSGATTAERSNATDPNFSRPMAPAIPSSLSATTKLPKLSRTPSSGRSLADRRVSTAEISELLAFLNLIIASPGSSLRIDDYIRQISSS